MIEVPEQRWPHSVRKGLSQGAWLMQLPQAWLIHHSLGPGVHLSEPHSLIHETGLHTDLAGFGEHQMSFCECSWQK